MELSGRYGVANDGGYEQRQVTAVAGRSWDSGGFLGAGDVSHNTAVRANQREFLSGLTYRATDISPESGTRGLLFCGHKYAGESGELSLDAISTERQRRLNIAGSTTTRHYQ